MVDAVVDTFRNELPKSPMLGKPFESNVGSKSPLPVRRYTFPCASAPGPSPLIQIAGPFMLKCVPPATAAPLLGPTFSTAVCASELWSYAMIQPLYGAWSQ